MEVVSEYDRMFLQIEMIYPFEKFLPFLVLYSKSKVIKLNPHYFLEYILKHANTNPKECLDLISEYKSYQKPSHQNGPYYSNELIMIVLNVYNMVKNDINKEYSERAIKLFDEMLQIDYLRREAHVAIELFER